MGLDLFARLGLNSRGFDVGLAKAEAAAGKFSRSLQSRFAAVAGLGGLTALARKTIDFASRVTDLSNAFGVSGERLQEFDYAAKQTGATLDDMTAAMRNLAKARTEALQDPAGDKAKAFAAFGLGADRLRGINDPSELLLALSDAVKGVNLDLNTMPAILDLIGNKQTAVIPALQAGLRQSGEEAKRLGLVMSDETTKALDDLGDAAARAGKRIMVAFAPVLKMVGELTRKAAAGVEMLLAGDKSGRGALDQKFGPGFRNPFLIFTADFWQTYLGASRDEAARIKEQVLGGAGGPARRDFDPDSLLQNQQKLMAQAEKRARLEEQILDKRRQLSLRGLSGEDLVGALEKEKAGILGVGLEKPSLEQQLKLADLDLELQAARRGLGGGRGATDSLAAIGGFTANPDAAESKAFHQDVMRSVHRIEESLARLEREPF